MKVKMNVTEDKIKMGWEPKPSYSKVKIIIKYQKCQNFWRIEKNVQSPVARPSHGIFEL